MNYSTLKKTVALSFVSLMFIGIAAAQNDTTKSKKMSMSDQATTAKIFGGAKQYNTWSVGVNVGVTDGHMATGGTNLFYSNTADFGYGVSVKDQISHFFGAQFDFHGGTVQGDNTKLQGGQRNGYTKFSTQFYSATLSGVIDFGSVSFLHRTNAINFYFSGGFGLASYKPSPTVIAGSTAPTNYPDYIKELILPIGTGVKFKLTDALDLNLGYTENFLDGFNFTGDHTGYPQNHDHYAYGYGGLEYTFGPKSKPSLEWVNPIAMMYDELYDAALRQEVEALKGRVTNVENAVNDLKKDSDGDGVADQFDKCPNTPANTVVDGSGCPIVTKPIDTAYLSTIYEKLHKDDGKAYSNIQFEFDSSVLKTSSYPILDATSADLRSNSAKEITLDGFASSEGTASHNMKLSKDRAESVKTYLVNSGVDAKRIKVKAYGETHPIADNSTEAGRILNRRVEFHK